EVVARVDVAARTLGMVPLRDPARRQRAQHEPAAALALSYVAIELGQVPAGRDGLRELGRLGEVETLARIGVDGVDEIGLTERSDQLQPAADERYLRCAHPFGEILERHVTGRRLAARD